MTEQHYDDSHEDTLPDMTAVDLPRGAALVEAIEAECKTQGIEPRDLFIRFEMQPSYWNAILSRNRSIQAVHRTRLQHMANFLGRSMIEVMSLAELVEPGDFVVRATIEDQLNAAYIKFKNDPMWAALAPKPENWDIAPRDVKVAFVLLYERLFGEELLTKSKIHTTVLPTLDDIEPSTDQAPQSTGTKAAAPRAAKSTAS